MTLESTPSDPSEAYQRQIILRRILFLIDKIGWRNGHPLTDDQRKVLQAVHGGGGYLADVKRKCYPWHMGEPELAAALRQLAEGRPRRIMRIGLDGVAITARGRKDLLGY